MSLIELDLAGSVMQTLGAGTTSIASLALIAVGSKYAAAILPFIFLVVYIIQKGYLRTSRQMRYMDLEALAPLISHCQETVSGCSTIRAFGWQRHTIDKNFELLDNSQKASYLMFCIQRWLNVVLDLLTAAIAVVVVALAMGLRGTSSAGSIGVALINVLSFSENIKVLITAWTTMETSLGAIARVKNFEASTVSEDCPEQLAIQPPASWPDAGEVTVSEMSIAYDSDSTILKKLSLSIPAGSKIGICGRSGSGKSSFILSLLRLLDASSGAISIDGWDLQQMSTRDVRDGITAIPQEVMLLPGSIRSNLDPKALVSDADIVAALEEVGLQFITQGLEGLNTTVADLSLSHGQRQLLAVARALLRPSKVLVMDEITASLDEDTERQILSTVHAAFSESTVVTVAHRLKTLLDYDTIVVLDAGRVVEMGKPADLLSTEGGWFKQLMNSHG
jgi:ABC-type multidrug transport system fused ATPase/permease subunit